jgi:hypothetical protein
VIVAVSTIDAIVPISTENNVAWLSKGSTGLITTLSNEEIGMRNLAVMN